MAAYKLLKKTPQANSKCTCNIVKITPQNGKVEGGEYIRILGHGFNKETKCKFGNIPATTFYSDSNNLFCKSPPSKNLKVGSVLITLYLKDETLNPHNTIEFEYIISKDKIQLISFIDKLIEVYKMPFIPSTKTKTQELINHSQDIIDNLEKLQSDCTLNERLISLKTEFQVLMDDISSQSNSKDVEKNSIINLTQELSEIKIL